MLKTQGVALGWHAGAPVVLVRNPDEEFLPGAQVTVGVAGNGVRAHVIGMMEIAFAAEDDAFIIRSTPSAIGAGASATTFRLG